MAFGEDAEAPQYSGTEGKEVDVEGLFLLCAKPGFEILGVLFVGR